MSTDSSLFNEGKPEVKEVITQDRDTPVSKADSWLLRDYLSRKKVDESEENITDVEGDARFVSEDYVREKVPLRQPVADWEREPINRTRQEVYNSHGGDLFLGDKMTVFHYLRYMVEMHDILSFTVVPYLPKHYEEDGKEFDKDTMPKPRTFATDPDEAWLKELNRYFKEFDWNILEIGISSRVSTIDGPRHMLMVDTDGRAYDSVHGDEIVWDCFSQLIFDGQIDPAKLMVLRSNKSFHIYDCSKLYTEEEWIKAMAACLLPAYGGQITVDSRWIGNTIYFRGYGIIRMTDHTDKYTHIPYALTAPEGMEEFWPRPKPDSETDDYLPF